ncbi:DNA gyrase inhibitor YacG [Alphaproteobacteria bacterium 46_93_T64]|nr:DNA gyrase inhibitor YacG [Alphaproteobacteria bacterium 46_93_T64]
MTTEKISNQKCPQCSKKADKTFRPFCSKRCQQLDLGKWLNESYAIPGEETIPANDEDGEY